MSDDAPQDPIDRLKRWRLALGGEADGTGVRLGGRDLAIDGVLSALYSTDGERKGGLGASNPNVARWLGDIRTYFPTPVVRVLQQDALERRGLRRMLLEPELLALVEPDVHLVAELVSLASVIPSRTKDTARLVVRKVVDELERRLAERLRQAVRGSLDRATRTQRPRHAEIDWNRTIRANLKHWLPEKQTLVAERRIGFGRRRQALRDIILCVDQSGSMATSVVYAGVFGAVLASIRALRTRMVVFDTAVVDLTDALTDPVDLLFGLQLGGGTDINRAFAYCESLVQRPSETVLVLISDLFEGGDAESLVLRAARLVGAGVRVVVLLALNDSGSPSYDHNLAARLADLGIPSFACTPDQFPDLMATALARRDLGAWAAAQGLGGAR